MITQVHVCVNDLPRFVMRKRNGRESQPWRHAKFLDGPKPRSKLQGSVQLVNKAICNTKVLDVT